MTHAAIKFVEGFIQIGLIFVHMRIFSNELMNYQKKSPHIMW
jgi:hypothetical protein